MWHRIAEGLLYVVSVVALVVWYVPMVLSGMWRSKKVCAPSSDLPEVMLIPATELAKRIANREIRCRAVIGAYIARMKEANDVLNAIVEERFDDAVREAQLVDERVDAGGRTCEQWLEEWPLLGVPLTVKESIGVRGMSNTAGYVPSAGQRASADAEAVAACRKAGAIILAVSNTPELCLNWETYNNLVGTTRNPYDARRTCGGSSGGEAAMIAAGASLIGLGSDLAGSLRFPAHCCGVFSHKPSAHAVSTAGHYPTSCYLDKWNSHFAVGPLCRYASDLLPMMRILVKDEFSAALNLAREVDISKVNIFFTKQIASVLCTDLDPQSSDALDALLHHFKVKDGLNVEPLDKDFFKDCVIPVLTTLAQIQGVAYPRPGNILGGLLKMVFNCSDISLNTYFGMLIQAYGKCLPDSESARCNRKVDALRDKLEALLGDNGVLLMPIFHRTADYHYTTAPRVFQIMNMCLFNAFGMPVTSCPIMQDTNGLPFGIQVVSRRLNDRLSLAVAREIECICGGWKVPHVLQH